MKNLSPRLTKYWPLLAVLLTGFLMRIYGLSRQSFWLDELHTMIEAGPDTSWKQMFHYLKCCDQHPPLYFIVERFSFLILGHNEFAARFISALAGTASILAMYRLGKEFLNDRLGLIAAILTCVNFYNLYYSQEARGYIFAFLFAALSFQYFIRLLRDPQRTIAIKYAVFSLLLLYSHYYSLFVLAAQACLGLLFIIDAGKEERKRIIRSFLLPAIIMIIGYAPWIPFLRAIAGIKSFWIAGIDHGFLASYFDDFFGNSYLLKLVLVALIMVFVFRVVQQSRSASLVPWQKEPVMFGFVVLLGWIFITSLIPYLRAVLTIPMMMGRYLIVILPALLVAVAFGIESFGSRVIRSALLSLVVLLSLIHIVAVRKYYTSIGKTQFREMSKYITENNSANYPIINERTYWHHTYYLNRNGSKAAILNGKKENLIDSILAKSSPKYDVKGFWIAGAHGDQQPGESHVKKLDSLFVKIKQADYMDAWAMLYVSKQSAGSSFVTINYKDFGGSSFLEDIGVVVIWNGSIQSKPVSLTKGRYKMQILAQGFEGDGQFPHMNVYVNEKKIGDYFLKAPMEEQMVQFEQVSDAEVVIRLEMDNDFAEEGKGDRNIFVKRVLIEKEN